MVSSAVRCVACSGAERVMVRENERWWEPVDDRGECGVIVGVQL